MRKLCTLRQGAILVYMGVMSLFYSTQVSGERITDPYLPEAEWWFTKSFAPDTTFIVTDGSCSLDMALAHPGVPRNDCGLPTITNSISSNDSIIGNFPVGSIIVNWYYVYEAASMCENDTVTQKIIIQDGVPPSITVIDDITTDCSIDSVPPFADFAEYVAAGGGAIDNCALDSTSWRMVDEVSDLNFNPETIVRRYHLADIQGNWDTVTHQVIVQDLSSPEVNCVDNSVSLSFGAPDRVQYTSFLNSTSDNCGGDVIVQIARMDEGIFRDSVYFICDDVGSTVMVILEVTDQSGNINTCMAEAVIEDKLDPSVMQRLTPITVSCSYPIDTSDLSDFGGWDINTTALTPIIIDDPELDPIGPRKVGNNGMILENCQDGLVIEESIDDQRNCGTGIIIRNFVITDQFGNSVTSQQTITVVDPSPFTEDDITWPERYMFANCTNFTPDTTITGSPSFDINDICSQPMVTFSDLRYDEPNSGCFVIERSWRVIDWCTYDKSKGLGAWEHTQYIKVLNTVPPVFVDQTDTLEICTPGSACNGTFDFDNTANDDCTDSLDIGISYEYDIDNDGFLDGSGQGNTFSLELDQGQHRIIWYAEDKCGNIGEKVQIVNVAECKLPTPICLHGVAVSLSAIGEAEIWASDFNNFSNDNCTPKKDLIFSFSSDIDDLSLSLDCGDLGQVDVEMWVTDKEGNQAFCVTYVDVQDNHNACTNIPIGGGGEESQQVMIAGTVYTPYQTPIQDAQINISGPEYETYKMTDNHGKYTFEELRKHDQYEVIPVKDDNPMAGVTTLDLVKIQRYLLGIGSFDSPYQLIAADVNNSENVSAADIVQLRKLILGIYDHFPENNSWRFVETKFGIVETDNPWPFIEGILVDDLNSEMMDGDFIGVKIGDVDFTIEENLTRNSITTRSNESILMTIQDDYIQAGEIKDINIKVDKLVDLVALQWTLSFDDTKMELVDWTAGDLKLQDENIAVRDGEGQHLSLAWTSLKGERLAASEVVLTIRVKALQSLQLSESLSLGSTITEAAAYNSNDERMDIKVAWDKYRHTTMELFQNTPNPFIDHTTISFQLPSDMEAQILITDISGKIAYQQKGWFNAGKNTVRVNAQEMNLQPGVVYYTLRTNQENITKKMIFLR